ncbi:MAG: hypothetical protein GY849_02680 [Deltaproteobacteria bacterium]|nr:hypothetical protein [Deltaproteobacteria bacterium]
MKKNRFIIEEIKYSLDEIRNYILKQDSLGDVLYNLKHENIKSIELENVCKNCEHQLNEECAIDGHEIWDDSTCEDFSERF